MSQHTPTDEPVDPISLGRALDAVNAGIAVLNTERARAEVRLFDLKDTFRVVQNECARMREALQVIAGGDGDAQEIARQTLAALQSTEPGK